jgi:ATP-dependent RNA circularization protein (DNA/RNA ligase family)
MLYNIRIEFMDGTVEKFQRRSNIKPLNSSKLNDKIANEIYPREWKEIISEPLY